MNRAESRLSQVLFLLGYDSEKYLEHVCRELLKELTGLLMQPEIIRTGHSLPEIPDSTGTVLCIWNRRKRNRISSCE